MKEKIIKIIIDNLWLFKKISYVVDIIIILLFVYSIYINVITKEMVIKGLIIFLIIFLYKFVGTFVFILDSFNNSGFVREGFNRYIILFFKNFCMKSIFLFVGRLSYKQVKILYYILYYFPTNGFYLIFFGSFVKVKRIKRGVRSMSILIMGVVFKKKTWDKSYIMNSKYNYIKDKIIFILSLVLIILMYPMIIRVIILNMEGKYFFKVKIFVMIYGIIFIINLGLVYIQGLEINMYGKIIIIIIILSLVNMIAYFIKQIGLENLTSYFVEDKQVYNKNILYLCLYYMFFATDNNVSGIMYYYKFSDGLIFMELANRFMEIYDRKYHEKEGNKLYLGLKSNKHNIYKCNNPIVLAELGVIFINFFCDRDTVLFHFFYYMGDSDAPIDALYGKKQMVEFINKEYFILSKEVKEKNVYEEYKKIMSIYDINFNIPFIMSVWSNYYYLENYQYRFVKNIIYIFYIGGNFGENVYSCLLADIELFLCYAKAFNYFYRLISICNVNKYIDDNEIGKDLANINKKFIMDIITNSRYDKFIKLWMEFYKRFMIESFSFFDGMEDDNTPTGLEKVLWESLINDIKDKTIGYNNIYKENMVDEITVRLNGFLKVPSSETGKNYCKNFSKEYEKKILNFKDKYLEDLSEEDQKNLKQKKIYFFRSNIWNITEMYHKIFYNVHYKNMYDNLLLRISKNEEISISKEDIIMEELEILLIDLKYLEKILDKSSILPLGFALAKYVEEVSKGEVEYVVYDYYGELIGSVEKKLKMKGKKK